MLTGIYWTDEKMCAGMHGSNDSDQIGNYRKSGMQPCVVTVPFTTEGVVRSSYIH